ncbi:MAG: RidA family protein [Desulfobacteraceae bacterium]|nr:RidA family protein [Desulfobacteraceae bacterium]
MESGKKTYLLEYAGKPQRFARSVIAGDFVFLSGSSGRTLETGEVSSHDAGEQTKVALEKVKLALKEAGSSLENIVKVQILFRDINDYEPVKQAEFAFYEKYAPALAKEPPASTVCQVASLSKPDMLVEFDIIALRGDR